jgi:signal transduction histidine kinase
VEREEDDAAVRIRDTGIGIAPDVLPHGLRSLRPGKSVIAACGRGLGIGLALVRGLVKCHGGRVTAASAGLRRGSEFTVRLQMPAEWWCVGRTAPINVDGLTKLRTACNGRRFCQMDFCR